jgi:tetrahydromethanopterin S-methyltransferase subunit F
MFLARPVRVIVVLWLKDTRTDRGEDMQNIIGLLVGLIVIIVLIYILANLL